MIHRLQRKQWLPITIQEAWNFFSSPANLSKITPPELDFVIKTDLPDEIYPGLMIEYSVRPLMGIPMTWLTEITRCDAPRYFCDEQRVGPYNIWHHEHWFREIDGGVECEDLVTYLLPFGILAEPARLLLVKPQLERIFDFRKQALATIFKQ